MWWWVSHSFSGSIVLLSLVLRGDPLSHSLHFPFLPLEVLFFLSKWSLSEVSCWMWCLVVFLEQGNNETALSMLWYGSKLPLLQETWQQIFIPQSKERKSAISNITQNGNEKKNTQSNIEKEGPLHMFMLKWWKHGYKYKLHILPRNTSLMLYIFAFAQLYLVCEIIWLFYFILLKIYLWITDTDYE